jgi:SAM-dependent methyltransferase
MDDLQIFKSLDEAVNKDDGELAAWSQNSLKEGNKRRYIFDQELLASHYESGRILEIGSAPYHLTYILTRKDFDITGIDIAPERQASFISDNHLNVVKCDIESEPLPFQDDTFHYIIFNEVFEHLRINPIRTLREINRVLHPEGKLALSTPNLYSIRTIILFFLGRGFDNPYEEFEKLETLHHMGHVREYSIRQMREFLVKTGFNPIASWRKSFGLLRGLLTPFNLVRKLIPGFHAAQYHICKKT